jgi:hypothetical protein
LFILNRKILFYFSFKNYFSFIISEHYLYTSNKKLKKKSRTRHIFKNFHQKYRSLCFTVILIIRLFSFIDKITKKIYLYIEKFLRIIKVIHGWIQMIRAICSAIYLLTSRIMLLIYYFHRIFNLLSNLFEPLSNRTFEKFVRSFSHFVFYYYSSNGACYTLQARTRHIVGRVRERWKRKCNGVNDDDNDIYYDAFGDENEWY